MAKSHPDVPWQNKEHKHERWESEFELCNAEGEKKQEKAVFDVLDAVASPGSFAGRTGHSGSTKFVIDCNNSNVGEYTKAKMFRQAFFRAIGGRTDADADAGDDRRETAGVKEAIAMCEWTEDCPIGGHGRQTISGRRTKVPWYTPSGKYRYRYELRAGVDGRGELLFCADVFVKVQCPDLTCPGLPIV